MISVERIIDYRKTDGEDFKLKNNENKRHETKTNWLKEGKIVLDNMSFRYDDDKLHALRNIKLCINSKEKIGIIGRTGAGKSTLFQALYRIDECEGNIFIDNIDTKELNLADLREKMSIIPV